jgi:esterase/lipase
MSSLASNLASKEFTVLNPTISLGLDKRSQSSACEAVHTYTMEEEVAEIGYWVNWLAEKGYKDIVLIGFSSTGNLGVLLYDAQSNHFPIRESILISLNPWNINSAEHLKAERKAGVQKNRHNNISHFTLGYCKNNFAATDKTYLSYARHDETNMLELLQHTTVPSELIFGTDDHILPADWLLRIESHLAQSPVTVTQVSSANHFFEGTSEFDLSEAVEKSLMTLNPH